MTDTSICAHHSSVATWIFSVLRELYPCPSVRLVSEFYRWYSVHRNKNDRDTVDLILCPISRHFRTSTESDDVTVDPDDFVISYCRCTETGCKDVTSSCDTSRHTVEDRCRLTVSSINSYSSYVQYRSTFKVKSYLMYSGETDARLKT